MRSSSASLKCRGLGGGVRGDVCLVGGGSQMFSALEGKETHPPIPNDNRNTEQRLNRNFGDLI